MDVFPSVIPTGDRSRSLHIASVPLPPSHREPRASNIVITNITEAYR